MQIPDSVGLVVVVVVLALLVGLQILLGRPHFRLSRVDAKVQPVLQAVILVISPIQKKVSFIRKIHFIVT